MPTERNLINPPQKMSLRDAVTSHKLFTKTRMYSLYSDFRKLKEANQDGYEANMIAWKALFEQLFTQSLLSHTFVLDTVGLQESLTLAEYGKPMSLDLVIEELVHSGELIPFKEFQENVDGLYTARWVRPVLNWAVNKFIWDTSYKVGDKKNGLKADKLVSKVTLEKYEREMSKRLDIDTQNGQTKHVFSKEQLKKTLEDLDVVIDGKVAHLTELDFEILLRFLERDLRKVKTKEDVIKFGDQDITEEDVGICQLKKTVSSLELKIVELQAKIDSVDSKLKQSLRNKTNKELSLNLLRSKKLAEQSLNKQIQSLIQLESVLYKIDESSTNLQLISALEKGSSLLKSLNDQFGSIEHVEQVMEEVEEQKYTVDKIADDITRLGTHVDDEEVEDELEQLLNEEAAKKNSTDTSADEIADRLNDLKLTPTQFAEEGATKEAREPSTPQIYS